MAAGIAVERVPPPLQADLAEGRLADGITNPHHFGVEGMQGEQGAARLRLRVEIGEEAVAVGGADDSGTMLVVAHRQKI